ncbi:uncharacterized protein LOC130010906 [Patella vulgata]|uniref:uncharacterized protein LOC130010906 n=1 Tax=Patella vulgata TaxID=6465 RepID=UPI0024A88E3E|nr:uncharacterized protein LOC130010906 [Patella vulgata]
MGHKIAINKQGLVTLQPLSDRCRSIQNIPRPTSSKDVRKFIGAVNYVSNFLPYLQSVLQPLHKISSKKSSFKWSEAQEEAFIKVKSLLVHPPVLYMPNDSGRITLYSDTSRTATGSYLTQIIDGEERIRGYYSKRLPKACERYSVTELELFGLLINISNFQYLLRGVEFDAYVDHAAIVHLCNSKRPPCTNRLQKLLVKLSHYAFKIGYKKGTELVLADFLSRSPLESDSEIDSVVPTAFAILNPVTNRPVTRQWAKTHNISVPAVFPSAQHQTVSHNSVDTVNNQPSDVRCHRSHKIPTISQSPKRSHIRISNDSSIKASSTTQDPRIVDNAFQPESPEEIEIPIELCIPPTPVVHNADNVIRTHFPKQAQLDKLLKVIKKKIIRDYNLPVDKNQLRLEQETSPFFKPVYDFLSHGILPSNRKAAKSVKHKSEEYIICDHILFRLLIHNDNTFSLQLAIPESLCHNIIAIYHDSLLSSHQGIVRTYLTIRKLFYFPIMFSTISSYITSCHKCQQFKGKTDNVRMYHPRIPTEYCTFDKICLDFKSMPASPTGFKHIMVVCDEITRFLICIPLKTLDAETICEAIIQKIVCIFGPPSVLITDAASSLTGKLVSILCSALQIDHKLISVSNHGSLMVERHIKSISDLLKFNLNQYGTDWVRYVSTCTYAYNSFVSPQLGNFSPYELAFGKPPKNLTSLAWNFDGVSKSYEEYLSHLKQKFNAISSSMLDLQRRQQEHQNISISHSISKNPIYGLGQFVYVLKPSSSSLTCNSRKMKAEWCGPLVVHQILDRTHYILSTLDGKILQDVYSINRLKPCFVRSNEPNKRLTHIDQLRKHLGKTE